MIIRNIFPRTHVVLAGHVEHLRELLLEAGDEVCAVLLAALLAPVVGGGQGGLHRHHHASALSLATIS